MVKRGYSKAMSIGPVIGTGGLAIMIPPSGIAIFMAAIAEVPTGKLLIAITVPGLLMALLYGVYIVSRSYLQPESAPAYEVDPTPLKIKLISTFKGVVPVAVIVFMVIVVVLIGVASPSEAAACGVVGSLILAGAYKRLNFKVLKESIYETLKISGMILLIIGGAMAFSQILSASGASKGLSELASGLQAPAIVVIIMMQIVGLILGCFMAVTAIIMITIPIFMPVVRLLGFDPLVFTVLYMINMEIGFLTPPLGLNLFVMKSVAPPNTTLKEIISASVPYILLNLVAMALIMVFPNIALWLPGLMR
jgi:tripartite ATP-independent transporter DctM subunit